MQNLSHSGPAVLAAFSASLVEFVEALTIVLAVGVSRSWRSALLGAAVGVVCLCLLLAIFGPLLTQKLFPLAILQLAIGVILLLFGLRWLRKAILRAAGRIPLRDEAKTYHSQLEKLQADAKTGFDLIGLATSFKAVLIEGVEVVFIIVAIGAAEQSYRPAILGAAAALALVVVLGIALHRPLTRIPENSLKFGVAVILSGFGLFWIGEGAGYPWLGGDLAIPVLILIVFILSLIAVRYFKSRPLSPSA